MAEIPLEMMTCGREVDNEFRDDERLYRGIAPESRRHSALTELARLSGVDKDNIGKLAIDLCEVFALERFFPPGVASHIPGAFGQAGRGARRRQFCLW
jgi:hypothetical protein